MHFALRIPASLPLRSVLAAAALAWLPAAQAQSFSADYSIRPALVAQNTFSGAGLTLATGSNWYAQFAVGHGLKYSAIPGVSPQVEAVSLGGGYRWADGKSLSLQVTGRTSDRLGLSVSYDWPRYFLRLQYDPKFTAMPAEQIRFSAGMRF